jgi:energy-coupling factor transport system ATP-binding protein
MENIIEIKDVSFRYQNNYDNKPEDVPRNILEHINLNVKKGEFLAVLGHNGSGKSTLAKLCNAILTPSSGTVFAYGMDTADEEKLFDIRRKIGMVFQNPDNQLVATVVEEDVAFGLENIGVPPDKMRERVDNALKAVEMYEYREHAPHKLSGGQKQRVAIAGIIAMKPECIVLDEPTAMLDPRGRAEVINTVRMLNRDFGITIIFITHYMEEAALADRIVVIDSGKVMLDGKPADVFTNVETMKTLGLDVPQVCELMFRLKNEGLPTDTHVITEEAAFDMLYKILK